MRRCCSWNSFSESRDYSLHGVGTKQFSIAENSLHLPTFKKKDLTGFKNLRGLEYL